ncbi:uncharacterized protein N7487_003679 [Penicillium crustosum]|uniref:uncharacterized protein n=1 Tax=Penicillium crustosum TaxID=36656 RepID=UPI0023A522D3|nr:uncharacterized protein N7487_003679 [Penicillium crustosum]KAJ5409320.1 hypothetical protein N7487_003679 [Penicillium crustosum]
MQQNQEKLDTIFNALTQDNLDKPQQSLEEFLKEPGISQKTVFVSLLLPKVAGDQLIDESSLYRNTNESK